MQISLCSDEKLQWNYVLGRKLKDRFRLPINRHYPELVYAKTFLSTLWLTCGGFNKVTSMVRCFSLKNFLCFTAMAACLNVVMFIADQVWLNEEANLEDCSGRNIKGTLPGVCGPVFFFCFVFVSNCFGINA